MSPVVEFDVRIPPGSQSDSQWCFEPFYQSGPASHSQRTYRAAPYRRLAGRRGKKPAIVAVGHTMLVMMYNMPRDGVDYLELGSDYLDKLQPLRLTTYLVKRLESLDHKVTLAPVDQAA